MQTAWVAFDVVLVVTLFALTMSGATGSARRWRAAISVDAAVTAAQVALYDAPRAHGDPFDWAVMIVSMAGPLLAAIVLWGAVGHRLSAPDAVPPSG